MSRSSSSLDDVPLDGRDKGKSKPAKARPWNNNNHRNTIKIVIEIITIG
jgi:hypothetical protein